MVSAISESYRCLAAPSAYPRTSFFSDAQPKKKKAGAKKKGAKKASGLKKNKVAPAPEGFQADQDVWESHGIMDFFKRKGVAWLGGGTSDGGGKKAKKGAKKGAKKKKKK
jgi:hypothetical protein